MRSLACKSHSLASKRAVIGRIKNFDILLAEYTSNSLGKPKTDPIPSSKYPHVSNFYDFNFDHKTRLLFNQNDSVPSICNWKKTSIRMWLSESLRLYMKSRKNTNE